MPSYRVRMAGRNSPDDPVEGPAGLVSGSAAPGTSGFTKAASGLEAAWVWLTHQPKRVRFAAGMIALFFAINVVSDGIGNPWFIYPSAPFALIIFLAFRREQRRGRLPPGGRE